MKSVSGDPNDACKLNYAARNYLRCMQLFAIRISEAAERRGPMPFIGANVVIGTRTLSPQPPRIWIPTTTSPEATRH